jgi:hypothetical protein
MWSHRFSLTKKLALARLILKYPRASLAQQLATEIEKYLLNGRPTSTPTIRNGDVLMNKLRISLLGALLTLTATGCCCWNPYAYSMLLVDDSGNGALTTYVSAEEIAGLR